MIKRKNVVVTREQLNEAKRIHTESYNEFVEKRRKLYNSQDNSGLVNTIVFATRAMKISRPKSMRQCIKEVTSISNTTTGEV